ncbi:MULTISPECIES: capping complex subunit for YIEGIA [Paenibacillus]|uniref:capping complex subunit for YIEGIA n=1 Tax=Paenibacillus TaxID=44249 RepID=UPI0022B897C9|nr:hypothetical protein [Paenibacillus caseinilyticus]MCZ8520554.1 hypothetical protein [Paenibacillus caseinilyticus]
MGRILAVITMDKSKVAGGAPIFIAANPEEQQQVAFRLEKIMDASAHDLQNGTLIIVKHG